MPKTLKRTIQGFRFEWEGGEYVEVIRAGEPYPFEVINTTRADGSIPPFNRDEFMREVADFIATLGEDAEANGRPGWLAELASRARETYDV